MFEAADPLVFEWYVKSYGNEINLFVDHTQVLHLEDLRQNIWGNKTAWGGSPTLHRLPDPAVDQRAASVAQARHTGSPDGSIFQVAMARVIS